MNDEPGIERRLTAILAADVVGYSRLMEADEAGTHARLKALRKNVIEPVVARHKGRIVKLTGDGALVEFPSAVGAVLGAAETQRAVAEHEKDRPAPERISFRIGVNLGDVIIDEDDIYGEGVNIAARLEGLAEPGGICVSGTVYNHVRNKVGFAFELMGAHRVKNIAEPVEVWRVVLEDRATKRPLRRLAGIARPPWAMTATAAALLVAIGVAGLWLRLEETTTPAPQHAVTQATPSEASGAGHQAPLDKYRIAVLPFTNISADAEDEYFSDGMTEELISKLSRLHDLTVIARTSIMQYKGTEKGIAEIGRELQVGTILEGSVRKAGERLRITAQLIDVASQGHLWSEDYDRDLTDVFAIQSDVAQQVAQALQITLRPAEAAQLAKAGTDDLEAYNAYLQGLHQFNTWSKQGLEKSIEYLQQAVTRDPSFAKAYAAMAFSHDLLAEFGYFRPDEVYPKVKDAARRALEIDATTAEAYAALAAVATYYDRDWIGADEGFRWALELNPNSAITHDWYGGIYLSPLGRHEEAIAHGKRAEELDPLAATIPINLAWSYIHARRWDDAIAACERGLQINPDYYFAYWCLGYSYLHKGMHEKALAAYQRGVELEPHDLQLKADFALAYATAGKKAQAERILHEFQEKARQEYVSPYAFALANMAVGDLDGAFAWLDKMYEANHPWLLFMNVEARFDILRGDPRFHQFLKKIGFKDPKVVRPASSG